MAVQSFQDRVAVLNKNIKKINLDVPNTRFQRPLLDLEREVRRAEEEG